MTNWFNAPYTGPTTSAGSSYATYLEDTSTVKAATYSTAFQNFINGSSSAFTVASPFSTLQGQNYGFFLGWCAPLSWRAAAMPPSDCALPHAPATPSSSAGSGRRARRG